MIVILLILSVNERQERDFDSKPLSVKERLERDLDSSHPGNVFKLCVLEISMSFEFGLDI